MTTLPDLARRAAELGLKVPTKACGTCYGVGSWMVPRTYRCGREAGGADIVRCGVCERGRVPNHNPEVLLMAVTQAAGAVNEDAYLEVRGTTARVHDGSSYRERPHDGTPEGIARAALLAFIGAQGGEPP